MKFSNFYVGLSVFFLVGMFCSILAKFPPEYTTIIGLSAVYCTLNSRIEYIVELLRRER